MAVFTLEDLTGAVETIVFPARMRSPNIPGDGYACARRGRFEVEDENNCKIIAPTFSRLPE